MFVGVLYNTVVCFIITIVSLLVFKHLRAMRKEKPRIYSEGLDYFCLTLGLLWFFVGLRTFFVWLGYLGLDEFIFKWFSGPLTYFHIIPLFFYFGWSFFKDKRTISTSFGLLFTVLTIAVIFTFYQYGFTRGEVTYGGTDFTPNERTNKLFTYGIFLPLLVCMIVEFLKRVGEWRRTKDITQRQLFGFSVGFLIYALMGIFDALGIAQDWLILLVRIGVMLSPLTFYIFTTWSD